MSNGIHTDIYVLNMYVVDILVVFTWHSCFLFHYVVCFFLRGDYLNERVAQATFF